MSESHLTSEENFNLLDTRVADEHDFQLARQYAPNILFDANEPFLPSVVGYTVFREAGKSQSFPRKIDIDESIASVIEYAIWWDWDIQHLYELEHIWIYVAHDGAIVSVEASWHGGYNLMVDEEGQLPIQDGVTLFSEAGKHAFAPSIHWLLERKANTRANCTVHAGKAGVHITPLFEGVIHERLPLNNRLVHTYLERQSFEPSYNFTKIFRLKDLPLVTWANLKEWIPKRVTWWLRDLSQTIASHERRGLRIAHRGASAYAQENSAESLKGATELGADMVEVDIRATRDHVPVVFHDATLKRLHGIESNISDITYDELQNLTRKHPILSFEETARLCHAYSLGLYLDLKDVSWQAMQSLFESLDKHYLMSYTIFGSFRPDYLAEIKAHRPDAVTSILFNSVYIDPVSLAKSVGADYVHPCWENRADEPHRLLTDQWIKQVREANLGIICWHEERPSEIKALWQLGVDGICSDTPERLIPQVKE